MTLSASIQISQYSTAGKKEANEDSWGVLIPEGDLLETKGIAMAIADGMSSCEAPKEASESCIKSFLNDYYSTHPSWTVKTSVARVLTATNRWLYSQGQNKYQSARGMVSTFSGLVLKSSTAHIFHIGDSRIYLLRGGLIEPLTHDHKTRVSEGKEYLSKAMGIAPNAEVDYRKLLVEQGDVFVFTTDGIHEFMPDKTIAELIEHHGRDLKKAAETIVQHALDNGSGDNLTCQIVRIEHTGEMRENDYLDRLSALPFPPHLEAGMKFEGFQILRELHASNRTQIYLAKDGKGKKVILKTPSINFEDDPAYLEMFTREEWVGNLIDNTHVVKVIKPASPRRFLYYVTEFIEGQTLREWMNDNPDPALGQVRDITRQLINGLRALHRKEIYHQDIKPENIVIDADGTVKIIDFGSARVGSLQEIVIGKEVDLPAGTINYSAPELQLGYQTNNQTDIYSIGVIVYEMVTGKLPYGKPFDSKRSLKRLNYISAHEHNEKLPFWMDRALQKAVSIDPSTRYRIMSGFLGDLTKPNPGFKPREMAPLLERNPARFWKVLALVSGVVNLALLWMMMR